jgi:phosphoserine aminotransferase
MGSPCWPPYISAEEIESVTNDKPAVRPNNPRFSSGPCTKHPSWSVEALKGALVGRYHRSAEAKARLELAIKRTAELLKLPADYRVAIVPASDTGAVEMALWSLLGARGVDVLAGRPSAAIGSRTSSSNSSSRTCAR